VVFSSYDETDGEGDLETGVDAQITSKSIRDRTKGLWG
jgi:hypothetical protein